MELRPILSSLVRNKTGAVLVAVQVAISMAILANAIHIVSLRYEVMSRPSGVAAEDAVFFVTVRDLAKGGHEAALATQRREAATLRALPGVKSVAQVNQIPMSERGSTYSLALDRKQTSESASVAFYYTPDSMVRTWDMKLVEGRDFKPEEVAEFDLSTMKAPPDIAIISKTLADKLWPGQAAVGKPFFFGYGDGATEAHVIGVVERLQTTEAQIGPSGEYSVVVPASITGFPWSVYSVRAEQGQMERLMKDAEAALRKASPNPVIIKTEALSKVRHERYRADEALSWMLVAVCVLLLLVTASGIVGMASLWVTQRRKQIGVRRALGARRVDILRYFVTENIIITSTGVLAGVLMAIGLNQFLVTALEMERLPVFYLAGGALVFWTLGVGAVYGPAWRAASISPALATRSV